MGTRRLDLNTPLTLHLHCILPIFLGSGKPDDYPILFSGSVVLHDEKDCKVDIGEVWVFLAQLGAARQVGLFAYDMLDSDSDTAEHLVLLGEDNEWIEDLQERFEIYSSDLLILNRIEIKEAYRGRGFALLALRRYWRLLGFKRVPQNGCTRNVNRPENARYGNGVARHQCEYSDPVRVEGESGFGSGLHLNDRDLVPVCCPARRMVIGAYLPLSSDSRPKSRFT